MTAAESVSLVAEVGSEGSPGAGIVDVVLRRLLSPIWDCLEDPTVSEVLINGPQEIWIERSGMLERTDRRFEGATELEAAMRSVAQSVGKRLGSHELSVEARLPDGSRVHMVQEPASRNGLCVAIRKFFPATLKLADIVARGTMTNQAAEFLTLAVAAERNIVVSGGTGSGKTTLLNCLSSAIPPGKRLIVIEDATELQLQQEHVVQFEAKPADRSGRGGATIRELFRASLRMRPDRIIVGECRGGEALDMIQAMTSGHSGSMSTVHANTPEDALRRIETMALMAGVDIPQRALRSQVASAIDMIVQIVRLHDGRRVVTRISEVGDLTAGEQFVVQDVFARGAGHAETAALAWTGRQPRFAAQLLELGLGGLVDETAPLFQEEDRICGS